MSRIVVYGSGSGYKDLLSVLPAGVEIVCVMESEPRTDRTEDGRPIVPVDRVGTLAFDLIVIAARAVDPIRAALVARGVAEDRIVAYYPSYSHALAELANRDIGLLNERLGLRLPRLGLATMYLDPRDTAAPGGAEPADFVRDQAFALAARQIETQGVDGAVAELGVYRGDQARLLNQLFPDRPLYLFDTFEGFADADLGTERGAGFSASSTRDFADTSVELVLGKLPFPTQARIRQGFFPATAEGIDERFAMVSLDVDLHDPILAGLNWFYDRLNPGGYIFVHDYNNVRYRGVREAVDGFLRARGIGCVALPDFAGSVVIQR